MTAPRSGAALMGLGDRPRLGRAVGVGDLAIGGGLLLGRDRARWMETRALGNVAIAGLCGWALAAGTPRRGRTIALLAAMAGLTPVDGLVARRLRSAAGDPTAPEAVAQMVAIDAPPAEVWEAMADVAAWPAWASHVRRVERREGGPFGIGSRVEVAPKGMPAAVWTVTEHDPPRSYAWVARPLPGLDLVAGHVVEPRGEGATATLSLTASGPLGAFLLPLLRPLFRRNTGVATAGLKRHCEARS